MLDIAGLERKKDWASLIKLYQNKDTDGRTRWQIAQILTASKSDRLIELLITALQNEADDEWQVAQLLGELGDVRAVEPLLNGLESSSGWRKRTIIEALGQLGDARAVEPLLTLIEREVEFEYDITSALIRLTGVSIFERLVKVMRRNLASELYPIIRLLVDTGNENLVRLFTPSPPITVNRWAAHEIILRELVQLDTPEARLALEGYAKDLIFRVEEIFDSKPFIPRVIASLGYKCMEFESGHEAFEFVKKLHPDLIFLDTNLLDMNIDSFISSLKNDENTKNTPIIVTDAKGEPLDLTGYSNVVGFMQKPIGVSDLRREITRVLGENPIQYPL